MPLTVYHWVKNDTSWQSQTDDLVSSSIGGEEFSLIAFNQWLRCSAAVFIWSKQLTDSRETRYSRRRVLKITDVKQTIWLKFTKKITDSTSQSVWRDSLATEMRGSCSLSADSLSFKEHSETQATTCLNGHSTLCFKKRPNFETV